MLAHMQQGFSPLDPLHDSSLDMDAYKNMTTPPTAEECDYYGTPGPASATPGPAPPEGLWLFSGNPMVQGRII